MILFHLILTRIFWKGITLILGLRFWGSEKLSHIILPEYKPSFFPIAHFFHPLWEIKRKSWLKLESELGANFPKIKHTKKDELNTENFLGLIKSIWPLHLNTHTYRTPKKEKKFLVVLATSPLFITSVTASSDNDGSLVYVMMNQDKKLGHMLRRWRSQGLKEGNCSQIIEALKEASSTWSELFTKY